MSGSTFRSLVLILLFNILSARVVRDDVYTPIVLWHGMGDSCEGLTHLQEELAQELPGVYMHCLHIGNSTFDEAASTYVVHPNVQVETACNLISQDPLLADGFNAIGLSQGSQFLRGVVQRCPAAKMKNLITLGGQHQGVYGFPRCTEIIGNDEFCDEVRQILNDFAYLSVFQNILVQATYWHNPLNETAYKEGNTYMSDINNEVTINQEYITRLQSLENLIFVKFEQDAMVIPIDSSWFGFYAPGQSDVIQSLEESALYTEDRLGLKAMNEQGKLHFLSTPGQHVQINWDWFVENILNPFLRN